MVKQAMAVVTCSKQRLVPKRGDIAVNQQLKVSSPDTQIHAGLSGNLQFGSLRHVFAAADGNVHFDGHLSFTAEDGSSVLVCYQVKHNHITNEEVAHFTWAQIQTWLENAREFMTGYRADIKLFVMVTNKEVRDVPIALPADLGLIHQGNLGSFFAPCLLASAQLALDCPDT